MTDMEKNYSPQAIEQYWYQHWNQNGYFQCGQTNGPTFTIMLPPPNVTGVLHMGHGFQHTLMDILARYHRMQGYDTLWQPGTDHAGIATQMVVERHLNAEGITKQELGREKFIEKVWEWKDYSGGTIKQQMARLGDSVDWSRERFTMDPELSKAVTKFFVDLYQQGHIYRGWRLVNWDPSLKTAVSDLEVEQSEEKGHFWYFKYPIVGSDAFVEIATTRPETMLGDAAIAVHPEDERYQHLIGQQIQLPLTNRTIPVIADAYVDPDFGTGCVKITPAHDFNDYAIGQRHDLSMINILNQDATLNHQVPESFQGMDRFDAREAVVEAMKTQGLLIKVQPHTLKVPRGDRSGSVIEPYLTQQWFVKTKSFAQQAMDVVENQQMRFVPDNWKNTYYAWMRDLQDWCISRQLWWGHRIPAWYDAQGNVYVGYDQGDVRQQYGLAEEVVLTQDEDVFDTWFSSALWPFSTLGWPNQTPELKRYYPTSVLVTGFDIIFFWVARMVMAGLHVMKEVPFKDIYVTGLIRDAEGQKMSKSKGNVLDPVDLIDGISLDDLIQKRTQALMQPQMQQKIAKKTKQEFPEGIPAYGADALRFTFAALASTSRDICFDVSRMEGYRNFCNKLWNGARFVLMNVPEGQTIDARQMGQGQLPEQWIVHQLNQTIQTVTHQIQRYRFDLVAQAIYEFVWHQYCDWYVELAKIRLADETIAPAIKCSIYNTMIPVLEQVLRLAHPVIPFITESIFQQIKAYTAPAADVIMTMSYPQTNPAWQLESSEQQMGWVQAIVMGIRTIRSEMNIKPSLSIPVYLNDLPSEIAENMAEIEPLLRGMVKAESIQVNQTPPVSATQIIQGLQIHIPLAGLINVASELTRLEKTKQKLQKSHDQLQGKLNNNKFVANAPAEVVEKEKTRLLECQQQLDHVAQQIAKIAQLQE